MAILLNDSICGVRVPFWSHQVQLPALLFKLKARAFIAGTDVIVLRLKEQTGLRKMVRILKMLKELACYWCN